MKNMAKSKAALRKDIIKKRNKLTPLERIFFSDRISEYVLSLEEVDRCENVLLYADYNGEVMTDKLALSLMLKGKKIYMPKVEGKEMEFYRVFNLEELRVSSLGIREPIDISDLKYDYKPGDLVILPGVAFDDNGHRLGYGGGYYDRYLSDKPELVKVGICYGLQLMDELPFEEHDIAVDYVISED